MTDLRQAAQALLNRWDSPLWKNSSTADAIADLRTALEQQAEPVAWMTHSHDLLPLFHRTERAALVWGAEPTPLYTAPPQRKPLTDEEIDQLLPEIVSGGSFTVVTYGRAVARAIEAKLKEKNT